MTINQTTIFYLSRSSLGQLYAQRSQLRPRTPNPPFSVWHSQLFLTGLDYKSAEHNQGWAKVRVIVKVGAPAVFHAQKRSANYIQMYQYFSIMTTQMRPKALLVMSMSILGVLNRTRVCMTPSQLQNPPQHRQSPWIHPVRGQLRDLGLVSSTACLLLPHKPNPNPKPSPNPLSYYKVGLTSKVLIILLKAR
jgi:hypothetical protein